MLKHQLVVALVRPYVAAELPMWGQVYRHFVGSFERDEYWRGAPTLPAKNKYYGYESRFDLSKWADRTAFFLRRWYDLPAQLMIRAVNPKTVVDVGANKGDFTLAAASMADKVISFEPNPVVAGILKGDIRRNAIRNVTLHEMGLSDRDDVLTLHVPHINSGSASFGGFQTEGATVENIPVRTGDEILEGEKPDLIKIDVEGFEVHAIRGMRQLIEANQPIIITEVIGEHLERCGASVVELNDLMASLGYTAHGMGTRRKGWRHELVLGVDSADVAWLPNGREPQEFTATTADLMAQQA